MMTTNQLTGLQKVEAIYKDRSIRARELKNDGRQIFGYFCSQPPLEMITAMDFIPFRVLGSGQEPITKADSKIPTVVCPFLRSSLDLGIKGYYDFLSGFVTAHSCDCAEKMFPILAQEMNLPFYYFIDVPHVIRPNSVGHLKDKLKTFQIALEKFAGRPLTPERLKQEIALHNRQRSLVKELYELRKQSPSLLSGSEALKITLSLMSLPIEEGSDMLLDIINEIKMRAHRSEDKKVRLMVWGTPLTETNLIDMIENLGASVVMDDICTGSRHFWPEVEDTGDPLEGIAKRYLEGLNCPRTFRQTAVDYDEDIDSRFSFLKSFAEEWNVDGVILLSVKYCDTHGYEVPDLKAYFEKFNIPALYLEHEYNNASEAQLKNRVEAFLEIVG